MKTEQSVGQDKVVYLVLTFGKMGLWRKGDKDQMTVDADKERTGLHKEILDSAAYRAIGSLDSACRKYVQSRSLPAAFLKTGVTAVPVQNIEGLEKKLIEYTEKRAALVQAFVAEYPDKVRAAMLTLRALFRAEDYPRVEDVSGHFRMTYRWIAMDVPEQLGIIDETLFENAKRKAAAAWAEAVEEWKQLLRQEMRNLCASMADRLIPGQTFKNSTVENMTNWLDEFDARNIADDKELSELTKQARSLLSGTDPDKIRDNDGLRSSISQGFQLLRSTIEVAPKVRKISFNTEEE